MKLFGKVHRQVLAAGHFSLLALAVPLVAQEAAPAPQAVHPPQEPLADLRVQFWTENDGLPSSAVQSVVQTHDGYIWASTYQGLARFDGLRFKVFGKSNFPGLTTGGVNALYETAERELWIGMPGSVLRRPQDGFSDHFELQNPGQSLTHMVKVIAMGQDGRVWAGTEDLGTFHLIQGELRPVPYPELVGVTIHAILQDTTGAIWVAPHDHGVVRIQGDEVRRFTVADGLDSDLVRSLAAGADGVIWIGTTSGLSRFAAGRLESLPSLRGSQVTALREDTYRNLWIGTQTNLRRRDAASGEVFSLDAIHGSLLGGVHDITFDREGGVWLPTGALGLLRLSAPKLRTVRSRQGLDPEEVFAITELGDDDFLIGAGEGALLRWRQGRAEPFLLKTPHVTRIRQLLQDRRGRLWIASYSGLIRVSGQGERLYTEADGLPTQRTRVLFEDREGQVWVGTSSGLVRIDKGGAVHLVKTVGIGSSFVMSIDEDRLGRLILGVRGALIRRHLDGRLRTWEHSETNLPGNIVFNTLTDSDDGAVWIATNGGLARLRGDSVQRLTAEDGLPHETIYDLIDDGRGSLWMSTPKGIFGVEKKQLTAVLAGLAVEPQFSRFDEREGMIERTCTGPAKSLAASDGRLLFPTYKGLVVLDPARRRRNLTAPPIRIERFEVDGQELALDAKGDLPPGSKGFHFDFAAPSFDVPSRLRIRFRLEGYDDDWREADAGRFEYTSLPHGEYAFRVVAENGDGVASDDEAVVRFQVRPSRLERPSTYVVAMALVALVVGIGYRLRIRLVEAKNVELKRVVVELRESQRERELLITKLEAKNEEIRRFTYSVSHDLKNPLVTIRGFLGYVQQDAEAGELERMRGDLRQIHAAAEVMSQRLEEILKLSRLGTVSNTLEQVSLTKLAQEAADLVGGAIREGDVRVEIDSTLPKVLVDRRRLLEVYQNLIANAVKFMGATEKPSIEVGSRTTDGERIFTVRDNGRGIDSNHQQVIFDLFSRVDVDVEGTGIGLATVRRVIEVHGGRVWVESEGAGQGSTFCFTLGRPGGGSL